MAATVPASLNPSLTEPLDKVRLLSNSKLSHQSKPANLLKALESSLPGPISPTAYYAALVSTLQQTIAKEIKQGEISVSEGDLVPAILYLLAVVVDFVPVAVVQSQSEMGLLGPLFQGVIMSGGAAGGEDADDEFKQTKTIISLFPPCGPSAPSLRSLIHLTRHVLLTAPTPALSTQPYQTALSSLLSLTLDPRPRVRKVSQEAIRDVLAAPHPPAVRHPYAERVSKGLIKVLSEKVFGEDSEQRRIWAIGFVRMVASSWPSELISPLLAVLLPLPSANPHLQSQTLSLLSHLLSQSTTSNSLEPLKVPVLLATILASPPKDKEVLPSWLEVVENGMISWAREDSAACSVELGKVWSMVWGYLEDKDSREKGAKIAQAAEKCLIGLSRYCIDEDTMRSALEFKPSAEDLAGSTKAGKKGKKQQIHPQDQKTPGSESPLLVQIISTLQSALHTLRTLPFLPSTLQIIASLISRMRLRLPTSTPSINSSTDPRDPTVAEKLLLGLVAEVADLRTQKGFEFRERADEVLGMAVEVMGPAVLLNALPLNVEGNRDPSQPGRAFLLPILRTRTTNTSLSYFTTVFVPLSERLFNAKSAVEKTRPIEAKVYEALVEQVWGCLKGFCDLPVDLPKAFTNDFAALITQVLYTQPSLRPSLLRSLQTLVETSLSLSKSSAPSAELLTSFGLDQSHGKANLLFLQGMSKNLLAVLFNVFSQVGREQRGMVGEVIASYLSVSTAEDISATYEKVVLHLGQALAVPSAKPAPGSTTSPTSHTMLDLLILLIPFLPAISAQALFAHASGADAKLIGSDDVAVQKKSYRVLARLVEQGGKVKLSPTELEQFVERLSDGKEVVLAGARRDRIILLSTLIPTFPADQLHLIPSLLPEAVLGTKEVNEKTRDAAFDLVVLMGNKMSEGGVIKRNQLEGADDEAMADASATIPEYLTMVAAGLVGTTPHMISASITALSRLIFEFRDDVPGEMKSELISTLVVFLSSTNREIVKSALGFVKVIVVILPGSDIQPHLDTLVPGLLLWSHDHKNHFKGKVRHIFERLIRKVSYESVKAAAEEAALNSEEAPSKGNSDGVKFLENIRKRKERSKRKKSAAREAADENGDRDMEDDDDDAPSKSRVSTGNAFDDALYGSESELDDSEDDEGTGAQKGDQAGQRAAKGKGKGRAKDTRDATFIRDDGDEPMDLLDRGIAGRLTKHDPAANSRRRKPGQEASKFKTDADTGKMMINDDSDNESKPAKVGGAGEMDIEGMAYQEQLTATEGQTRGARGQVVFNKDTKRGRAREADGEAMLVDASEGGRKKAKKEKQTKVPVGMDYKAKRAGGDIKRAGAPDPFAYVPLSQARGSGSRQHGKGQKVNITGKKKGSAA